MTKFNELLNLLHRGRNPYEGYPAAQWCGAWYNDPGAQRVLLQQALDASNAGLVIEVGSFVGESAIFMANHLKASHRDAAILCIDTWCGGIDHYKGAPDKINMHFGRPDLYYRFFANVIHRQCHDMILPLAIDSLNGARLLKHFGLHAEMIYIDASHEEGDVLRDYEAYWELLRPGGVFVVDDVSDYFPGVVQDWLRFAGSKEIDATKWTVHGEKVMVVKP